MHISVNYRDNLYNKLMYLTVIRSNKELWQKKQ